MLLLIIIFMSFSPCAVCKMSVTLALLETYDSQSTHISQNTEYTIGTVFTSF